MIEILVLLGVALVAFGGYFVFAHPYTRARSYARSTFLSGGGNPGVVLIALGIIAIVLGYYLPS